MLDVTRQGFYNYLKNRDKPYKYQNLIEKMREIIDEDLCNDTYGSMRMREALEFRKTQKPSEFPDIPSERTVYRIMRENGLIHKPKYKPNGLTKADKAAQKADNLIKNNTVINGKKESDFLAERPCGKTVTDITETACIDGKLYISILADCFNNEILGLSMADNKIKKCSRSEKLTQTEMHNLNT